METNSSSSSILSHKCISTFKAHSSSVFSLTTFNKFLFSGSSNNEIRLHILDPFHHSLLESKIVAISKSGAIKSLVISSDKLISAHQDQKIRVWQINNNKNDQNQKYKLLATLPTLTDRLLKIFPPKNYVEVRRHKKVTWVHHVDAISSLCLSPDESLLYSVSWDRTMKIWRTSDFKCLESLNNAHDDAINSLTLCKNGFVYTGSADTKIKIWKKNINGENKKKITHSVMAVLDKHKSSVNALVLSNDGLILYSGGSDSDILVWEKNGENYMNLVGCLKGHRMAILCLSVISDLVCSGSADKTVRVWRRNFNGSNYSCLAVMEGHAGPIKCLTTSLDYNNSKISASNKSYLIYSGSLDCDIKVWQVVVSSV